MAEYTVTNPATNTVVCRVATATDAEVWFAGALVQPVALLSQQCAGRVMNPRTIDGAVSRISLGLHIDSVESEWVLADDAIDACVTGALVRWIDPARP